MLFPSRIVGVGAHHLFTLSIVRLSLIVSEIFRAAFLSSHVCIVSNVLSVCASAPGKIFTIMETNEAKVVKKDNNQLRGGDKVLHCLLSLRKNLNNEG